MAIEKALGIDAPPRATHVRTILIEFSRMTSHLAFLSWLPWRVADFSRSGRYTTYSILHMTSGRASAAIASTR